MQENRASKTAEVSAMMRAAHLLLDDEPWIFVDEMALALIGLEDKTALRERLIAFEQELTQIADATTAKAFIHSARLGGALRARYAEDALAEAQQRGVSQYVILGAGLDSFSYCRRNPARALRVYEVDHRDTQRKKIALLQHLKVRMPAELSMVEVDFETESIFKMLCASGFLRDEPAMFCLPGVTWYLTDEAIDGTLREIGSAAPGSQLVLDYLLPHARLDEEQSRVLKTLEAMAGAYGEPGKNCLEPERIAEWLGRYGFIEVSDLSADEANARYCARRSDGLRIPELLRMVSARVGPA